MTARVNQWSEPEKPVSLETIQRVKQMWCSDRKRDRERMRETTRGREMTKDRKRGRERKETGRKLCCG